VVLNVRNDDEYRVEDYRWRPVGDGVGVWGRAKPQAALSKDYEEYDGFSSLTHSTFPPAENGSSIELPWNRNAVIQP
jgi:hypothetical protein